ncbi:unannotated protein [freshwater metagenome]|uniref:histidine kinase n=1 Tax=freshwater metagenome TaxID=449393 RepID=A0A6J7EW34_9ZZZZ|nr:HAMP domain-containing protein [Actinomycetota bacterium]
MSLRLRLTLSISLVVALSLGLLGFALVRSTRMGLLNTIEQQLEHSLYIRANSIPPPATAPQPVSDPRGRETAHIVVSPTGIIIVSEPSGPPSDPSPLPLLGADDLATLRAGRSTTADAADHSLSYLVRGALTADGRLEIEAAPLDGLESTMSTLVRRLVIGTLITLLLAAAAVVLVLRRGLRPLRQVIETADAVAAGEREQRIPTDAGPAEIRHLAGALDRMLQQQRASLTAMEETEGRLRRFISDASHELQTPITSVLGWTQLQRRGALDAKGEVAAMARIEAESRRMAALVEDLLLLARLDEPNALQARPLQLGHTDLSAVANDAVIDASAVEPARPITLDAPMPVIVQGDAGHVRQMIDNLLRNVRVHTPAGTPARVVVRSTATGATVTVQDDGPGIEPEHLEHVFDRFWRSDPSRARSTGGSGLGLAIVVALAEANDATVTAANRPTGGAAFTVTFAIGTGSGTGSETLGSASPPGAEV